MNVITRPLLASALAVLLLAAPAAAQSGDPATKALIAMMDICLGSLKGDLKFEGRAKALGYNRTNMGGFMKTVSGSKVTANLAQTYTASGLELRVCVTSLTPASKDLAGLRAAVAERAQAWPLAEMAPKPDGIGGTLSGYQNLAGRGLIGLTITETPAKGEAPGSTGISAIWRAP